MDYKKRIFSFFITLIRLIAGFFGNNNKILILSALAEDIIPVYSHDTRYGTIRFSCLGGLPLWRARTLLTKEPETIEWIDTFEDGEVLWDIGANIGCYSLYAARKGNNVVAFEPSAANFFLLQKNIESNGFDKNIQALCLALSDQSAIGFLNMSTLLVGGAYCRFDDRLGSADFGGENFDVQFSQGILAFSIDEFIRYYRVPVPDHIKIDVDGTEQMIIRGAAQTLQDKALKSLLIECDTSKPAELDEITMMLENAGFSCKATYGTGSGSGSQPVFYNCIYTRRQDTGNNREQGERQTG
jgi:FkbM family methyltransferase